MTNQRYDHTEPGWWIPAVESPEEAASIKGAVLQHVRKHFGTKIIESGRDSLLWMHNGERCGAHVGRPVAFHNITEPVWTILRDEDRRCYLVVTTNRGALRDGPILVGHHSLGHR